MEEKGEKNNSKIRQKAPKGYVVYAVQGKG